jgi:NAD(P)-dependent dehydrogenase (short-subunit alcohol dehydrogenase family)
MQDFKDKVAVVTGAASGIGLALAKRFASEGAKLVLVDIEQAALEQAAAQLPSGTEVMTSITDVSNAEQMDALAHQTFERFGTLHVLCNNAGVGGGNGPVWELSTRDWQWVLGVNLWGVIHGVRVFGKRLVEQNEGYIINTASVAGLTSNAGLGPYNVSKHGVVTYSETLFAELKVRKSAVGVSVLCPAFVATKIHESERNRPADLKNAPKSLSPERLAQVKQGRELIASLVASGQAPDAIADKVIGALRERKFYILTHPEMAPLIEQRIKNVLTGADPTSFG